MTVSRVIVDPSAPWFNLLYLPGDELTEQEALRAMKSDEAIYHRIALEEGGEGISYVHFQGCLFALPSDFHSFFCGTVHGRENDVLIDVSTDTANRFVYDCTRDRLLGQEQGNLYLIRCNDFFKIGITQNMENRFGRYVTENPYPLQLLFEIEMMGYQVVEGRIKRFFGNKVVRGEWFQFDYRDLRLINRAVQAHLFRRYQNIAPPSFHKWLRARI